MRFSGDHNQPVPLASTHCIMPDTKDALAVNVREEDIVTDIVAA